MARVRHVGVGRRALALAVDTTLWWIPYSIATGGYSPNENGVYFTVEDGDLWLLIVLLLTYFTAAESLVGATVGKWTLRVRVRTIAVWRDDERRRYGDRAARTVVVRR